MTRILKLLEKNRGSSSVFYVFTLAAIILFIVLPLFSAVFERYIFQNKLQKIKDELDVSNLALFNAVESNYYSKTVIALDSDYKDIYNSLLSSNLKLDPDLRPLKGSIVDGQVTVDNLEIFVFVPVTCPHGTLLDRPAIHSLVVVPLKPTLYRRLIFGISGEELFNLSIHVDTEIPVNN